MDEMAPIHSGTSAYMITTEFALAQTPIMETPPPPSSGRSSMSRITKRDLLSIIKQFPFEVLLIPSRFPTNREDIPAFIGALTHALKTTLLESAPARVSPRKLIEPSVRLAYEPATPTPMSTSTSRVITAEEEEDIISTEPTPFMIRLRGAQEFEDEQNKQKMTIDVTEMKVKVKPDTLEEEAHIGVEELASRKINEEQMANIAEGESLDGREQGFVKAQHTPLLTSNRSLVSNLLGDRAENVDSIDSSSIDKSPSLTQGPTLNKSIDLESADDPEKLPKAALKDMAFEGFPLPHSSNLVLADERAGSSNLHPPPPNLPFYSKVKPISTARRALMRDLMEETRRTLQHNPYILVDLDKEPNLGLPMVYVNAVYEPYE